MSEGIARRNAGQLRALPNRGRAAIASATDPAARPHTRWCWFSGPIEADVIEHQFCWARDDGFGASSPPGPTACVAS